MIGRADIKGSEKEFELLSTYVLVRFWIEDKILFFGLRENKAKKFSDAQLFNHAMTVLFNFAVTWDSRSEKVRAYFKRENSLLIYINEILQNSSPLFCSALTHQHMVFINHATLF